MDKRTEELKALANILLVVACVGLVMCCTKPNKVVGLLGVGLVAVGFIGAISFDSLAECTGGKFITEQEEKMKRASKQMDELREVEYSFLNFLKDNDCTLDELIRLCDEHNLNINYVYDQYQIAAGDDSIQSRQQVQEILNKGRNIA